MIDLLGTYECKMDAKGRFMFPAVFKSQLGDALSDGMVIKRSIFKKCIELFPKENWQHESRKVNKLNMFNKRNSEFVTKFMAGVNLLEFDGIGRLLIPKNLISYGGITKQIVLTAGANRIEIWDKEAYDKIADFDSDDFADLAQEVLGAPDNE